MAKLAVKTKEEVKKVEVEGFKPVVETADQIIARNKYLDSLNEEKAMKEVAIRDVKEIRTYIKHLEERKAEQINDHEVRNRKLQLLADSIRSANSELVNLEQRFEREYPKLVEERQRKLDEINKADATFQDLVRKNSVKEKELERDRLSFNQERENNRRLVEEMRRVVSQSEIQWKKREEDVLGREKAIQEQIAKFEEYQSSIKPEIDRITSIKNENLNLEKKIQAQAQSVENLRLTCERMKHQADEDRIISEARIKEERMRIANEDARLRQWEKEIQDQELEFKVKVLDAQKMLKREKLEEKINKAKENQ